MTFGLWLDRAGARLLQTEAALADAGADTAAVADYLAARDLLLRRLTRLTHLVATGQPQSAPTDHVQAEPAATLLRAIPTPAATGPGRTPHTQAGWLVHSAAGDVSIAADILVSHIDPARGPRTPQGAAIRLGAGRTPALAELAALTNVLADTDRTLLRAVADDEPIAVLHGRHIDEIRNWLHSRQPHNLATIARLPHQPDVVRVLQVAAALAQPALPRVARTVQDCAAILDDFGIWAFRQPANTRAYHLAAATRIALTIATTTFGPDSPTTLAWRAAKEALSRFAAPRPIGPDLRMAELGHLGEFLGTASARRVGALATRLSDLAAGADSMTRQMVQRGALLTKTSERATRSRSGDNQAQAAWTRAEPDDDAVLYLLDTLDRASASTALTHGRAFPRLTGDPAATVPPAPAQRSPASRQHRAR